MGDVVIGSSLIRIKLFFKYTCFAKTVHKLNRRIPKTPLANSACPSYNQRNWDIFHFMRLLRVFLCHASQDKPAVRKLHRYLKQRGVQPWLDELDLLPGENWEVEIPKALFSSDVILVCLSKNSVDKEGYVQKEITFALDKALEKPEGTIFVVPVKLEDCDVPKRLNRFQWVDVFRQDGYKRLMLGLQKRASGLGTDVSPVILEETRKTPKPEKKKPEEQIIFAPMKEKEKEEPKKEIPTPPQEEKAPEAKFSQQKPFTKLLNPASLSLKRTSHSQDHVPTDKVISKNKSGFSPTQIFTFSLIVMLLFIVISYRFGLGYFDQYVLFATATASLVDASTPKLLTLTSVPSTQTPTPAKTLDSIPTKTPSLTPALGIESTMKGEHGETLVYIPAGEFAMGDDSSDAPVHRVYLEAFWIDQTEVTNEMYAKCVASGECDPPKNTNRFSNSAYANHPVIYVNWNMANVYCHWAGRRLPTEAEWEKAAQGTDIGNPNITNRRYNTLLISEVGKYPDDKNIYGAYDLVGNVFEWVNDWYSENYYKSSPFSNPKGPDLGQYRVARGGSWYNSGFHPMLNANPTGRLGVTPSNIDITTSGSTENYFVGFRCAYSAK
jgi:formylglycine-generating enzyme required for sulfatase activity